MSKKLHPANVIPNEWFHFKEVTKHSNARTIDMMFTTSSQCSLHFEYQ
jgi:hypothetical protein